VARHDHGVGAGGDPRALGCKRLTEKAFDPVALNSASDLSGHGQAESRRAILLARKDIENELTGGQ
jgi:hypothetical protein